MRTGSATRPSVYTIPLHLPFAETLASHVREEMSGNPLALARTRILLPNRRASRSLADAFLRQSNTGLLLPQLQPLGDIDALQDVALLNSALEASTPPAVDSFERMMMLSPLIEKWSEKAFGRQFSASETIRYARELARQIDQFDYAGLDYTDLEKLLPEGYSFHWQQTLTFLEIALQQARDIWAADGKMGPAARRVKILKALATAWIHNPPKERILVAGSTGSIPVVAELMSVIARLPGGTIILPSLDLDLDEDSWISLQPNHPQFALKQLLEKLSVSRADVEVLPGQSAVPGRRTQWVQAALWPSSRTADWQATPIDSSITDAVSFIDAKTDAEEARAIAVYVRDQLREPEKTIAIVTSDRLLARRIAAALTRYGINVDDSAGMPLTQSLPAGFLRQLSATAAKALAPVELLALLKHPLSAGGTVRPAWLDQTRLLDKSVLRGLRPAPGLAGLRHAVSIELTSVDRQAGRDAALQFVDTIETACGNFFRAFDQRTVCALDLLHAHISAAESLAATETESGELRLWCGDAGEVIARTIRDIAAAIPPAFMINPSDYPAWLDELLSGLVVRPRFGKHPRVKLLSPIEARLQRDDVMILAGLNEGSWPPAPQIDPFLADHMRQRLGLPTSEFRLGQSAHDFAQAMGAEKVLLTRSAKSQGSPTLPSRFWLRVLALAGDALKPAKQTLEISRALDQQILTPCAEPLPRPGLSARPTRLSISDVGLWRQNPYAFYAKRILRLYSLKPIDQEIGPLDRGNSLHKALELFFKRSHGERTFEALLKDGEIAFADILDRPQVRALWWPRFVSLAEAVLSSELMTGPGIRILTEIKGAWTLPDMKREITIEGRADRIDVDSEGSAIIYDYKSGTAPTKQQIRFARQPQMALLALIAKAGTLRNHDSLSPNELTYVKISGRLPTPLEIKPVDPGKSSPLWTDLPDLMTKTVAILQQWAGLFEQEIQAYKFLPAPERSYGHDYDYLARVQEWQGRLEP
jgi:ATP-dependent helicase/nuclease subunit B